ncbi:MAG: hypothetical protein HFH68_10190 [Lachnospiraceae bacterium]|nr:hypothetical protein [Lachnospiraceae bacterium]
MDKAFTNGSNFISYNDYNKNKDYLPVKKNYKKKHTKRKKFRGIINILIIFLFIIMCVVISRALSSVIFDLINNHDNTGNKSYTSEIVSGTEKNRLIKQLKEENYPESLVTLFEKHPETKDFVLDYKKYKDKNIKINIKKDVNTDGIPLFLQWDKRWGYKNYGGSFIAVTGCGPACLSMVQCGLSGKTKWNPYRVARMAENNGFYIKGSGSSWDLMTYGASKIGLNYNEVPFQKESILNWLDSGNPIICSMGPGDFTTTGHFIVLAGTDSNGDVIVNDPNSKENSSKTWSIDKIMQQTRNLWGYSL